MDLIPDQGTRYFPDSSDGKASACSAVDLALIPEWRIPWRKKWQPTPHLGNNIDRELGGL